MVLIGIQQAACHGLFRGIYRCDDNRLDQDAGSEAELAVAFEVYFSCTAAAAARREEPIFQLISLLEPRIIFLLADFAYPLS